MLLVQISYFGFPDSADVCVETQFSALLTISILLLQGFSMTLQKCSAIRLYLTITCENI